MMELPFASNVLAKSAQHDAEFSKIKRMASKMESKETDDKELMDACREFESILTFTMLKRMREAGPKSDLLHSSAEGIYQNMLDQEITKNAAKGQAMGIAEMLYKQFTKGGARTDPPNGPKIE